jgi:hypothetical protein
MRLMTRANDEQKRRLGEAQTTSKATVGTKGPSLSKDVHPQSELYA